MSTQPLSKPSISRNAPLLRAALALCAAVTVMTRTTWASTAGQTAITAELATIAPGKTITTAKSAALAAAVAKAIIDNPVLTAADIASSAIQPFGGKTRSSFSSDAALVSSTAVATVALTGTANVNSNIANTVDMVATVAGLKAAAQSAVVEASVATLSDLAATSGTGLLTADFAIGAKIEADAALQALVKNGLTAIIADGLTGVTGVKGNAQTAAPLAAAQFIGGVLSSGIPNGQTLATFTTAALAGVSKNGRVVEYVSYQAGQSAFASGSSASLVTLGDSLIAKYSSQTFRIVQGLVNATPVGVGVTNREATASAFINSLTTTEVKNATGILYGAIYGDPAYAQSFTQSVFDSVFASPTGSKTLAADASKLATAAGNVLGQDGDNLTGVASVFSSYLSSGKLSAANAGVYLKALITGATKSKVPASDFAAHPGTGGGVLFTKSAISTAAVFDLASILNQFTDAVINSPGTTAAKVASISAALVADTIGFAAKLSYTDPMLGQTSVARGLLGYLSKYLNAANVAPATVTAIDTAIKTALKKVLPSATYANAIAILNDTATYLGLQNIGNLAANETDYRNL